MNNQKQNNYRNQFDPKELVAGLNHTNAPLTLEGTLWSDTTPKLASKVANIISEDFGIREIDQVFIYPERNKRGDVEDFGVVAYFMCDQNGDGGNIKRLGGSTKPGANRTNRGSTDLRCFVSPKLSTGGFQLSDHFKSKIGAIAQLTDDGNIVIKADNRDKRIAMVSLDFWKVMSLVMDIDSESPYDFTIIECNPLNTKSDCMDFAIKVIKSIEKNGSGKNRRSNIDYSARNRAVMFGK